MRGPELRVEHLTATHRRHPAVHHLSARFAPGSLTAIVGPNGAGKTTLLRTVAGLHRADEGAVTVARLDGGKPRIALLPQQSGMDRAFPILCRDVVLQGLWSRLGPFRGAGRAEREQAAAALAAVGLAGFEARPVGEMSAGQFQRLLFARLLVQDADLILLDEPFNAVDARTAADLLAVLRRWHGEGRTVVAVLHDLDLVRAEFPQTLLLAREKIAFGPTAEALSAANRLKARMMAEAWTTPPAPAGRPEAMEGLFGPFLEFGFMRRALVGCLALAIAAPPLGVFLMLRRTSLTAEVLAHGVTPGIAAGYLIAGLSVPAMSAGGLAAGLAVALGAGALSRATGGREDAALTALYLIALALGVTLVSLRGDTGDLTHLLFGQVLGVDDDALLMMAGVATLTLPALALAWRPLALETFDPAFARAEGTSGGFWHMLFLALVVLNVLAAFQAMGTLMAVGLMMLPAVAARHWARQLGGLAYAAVAIAALSAFAGLSASYHLDLPSGPAIVLTAGLAWAVSVVAGPVDGLLVRLVRRPHLAG